MKNLIVIVALGMALCIITFIFIETKNNIYEPLPRQTITPTFKIITQGNMVCLYDGITDSIISCDIIDSLPAMIKDGNNPN